MDRRAGPEDPGAKKWIRVVVDLETPDSASRTGRTRWHEHFQVDAALTLGQFAQRFLPSPKCRIERVGAHALPAPSLPLAHFQEPQHHHAVHVTAVSGLPRLVVRPGKRESAETAK